MDIIISPATENDVAAIHTITQDAFQKYVSYLGLTQTVSALTETHDTIKVDLKQKNILVAKQAGKVIGTIRYHYITPQIAYISRFAVDTTIHNAGVGKRLLDAVIANTKEDGANIIALHTASKCMPLVRLYYGKGFYIHSTDNSKDYIRALFIYELNDNCSNIDYVLLTTY